MNLSQIIKRLSESGGQFALYFKKNGAPALFQANADRFSSASMIKVPILLAWAALEQKGEIHREEICSLDEEPQVHGSGFAHRMLARRLPYHDVLLMMIATSDNLCTNLVIRRIGIERLNAMIHQELGLPGCDLQRKLMDLAARERGLDNWVSAQDCIRMFELIRSLPDRQREWVESVLLSCQDSSLLMRNLERDSIHFYHKTGSIPGVLHDWGFTRDCEIFLLTNGYPDELALTEIFGQVGEWMRPKQNRL